MKMDQKLLSSEPHEIAYVKSRAKSILSKTSGKPHDYDVIIKVSTLRRLCKYVIKK